MASKRSLKPTRKPLSPEKLRKLEIAVVNFVDKHRISCPEVVSQNDDVILDAYEFVAKLATIVGYYDDRE